MTDLAHRPRQHHGTLHPAGPVGAPAPPTFPDEPPLTVGRPPLAPTAHPGRGRPLRPPRPSALLDTDAAAVLGAAAAVVLGTWTVHGGLADLTADAGAAWESLARLTGLLTSAAGLLGLLLVARTRSVERRLGLDRLFVWHRILGGTMAVLLAAHVGASVVAWSTGPASVPDALHDLTVGAPGMTLAVAGTLLVAVVTISSLRSIRRQLAYETWYLIHLTAYVGLALSFDHQLLLGTDLADDAVARGAWVALHVAVLLALVVGRWGHLLLAALRPLRVVAVEPHNGETASLHLSGRHLPHLRADAGQFFLLRPLHRDLWWQAHPFSLSASPTEASLRFTVKDRGDASGLTSRLPVGTRVVVEGPYGVCTPEILEGHRPLFVVGGIGVAPAVALAERLGPDARPVVLFRAHDAHDLVLLDELEAMVTARGGRVHTLLGPTAALAVHDPFGPDVLRATVPDLADRTAVLCGPERLLHAARSGLIAAGLPSHRIHFERPWW